MSELSREQVEQAFDAVYWRADQQGEKQGAVLDGVDALRATITQQAQELEKLKGVLGANEVLIERLAAMTTERDEKAKALDSFEITLNETIAKLEASQARCREMEQQLPDGHHEIIHKGALEMMARERAQLQATLAEREARYNVLEQDFEAACKQRDAAVQEAERLKEACAKIAERNTYMNPNADDGGNHGGPGSCEYGCGSVIAKAIRELK